MRRLEGRLIFAIQSYIKLHYFALAAKALNASAIFASVWRPLWKITR
jgi:hypothetical protein